METVPPQKAESSAPRWEQTLARIWRYLSKPGLTVGLVTALIIVTVMGVVIPQHPTDDSTAWIAQLPTAVRPWGQPLYFLGLAHIFSAWWFWLPVALLLLHSLVMLANLFPGLRPRLAQFAPPLTWQHPLARRIEHVVRLSRPPDEWLVSLRRSLTQAGFRLNQAADTADNRLTGAVKHRWAWLGWSAIYAGLVFLTLGLFISHNFLEYSRLTLFPARPQRVSAVGGALEWANVQRNGRPATALIFASADASRPALAFDGMLYRPVWINHNLIIPVSHQPLLTAEVRDSTGQALKLIPVQEELPPDTKIELPLTGNGDPLYFFVPGPKLAIQIIPHPDEPLSSFNVQARRDAEAVLPPNVMVEAGQSIAVNNLQLSVGVDNALSVLVYFDPALVLYLLAILLIGGGLVLNFATPPVQLWLIPEVKGMGGQLYGVIETTGPIEPYTTFLEQLLTAEE